MQTGCRHPIANNAATLVIANNDAVFQHGNTLLAAMWIGPEQSDTDGNIIAYFFVEEVEILLWEIKNNIPAFCSNYFFNISSTGVLDL